VLSWLGHALGGYAEYNQQQLEHGGQPISLWGFVTSAASWFQSLQNWLVIAAAGGDLGPDPWAAKPPAQPAR
jgi:hypothetical protein